ncbi:DNA polymerase Y family protein [Corynebacterium sp. zg254]|uniref:DNA polymerase Y family protein n=1 Tax=Corynebacterium zhongnanshanii TaxID=2768834 RepID=A0ABQ6VER6_9CORY|nr:MULTISPECIES: DNA polymerase Y family protein [Corynebacterium]KAB3522912.1 DNA polymerase Y family protein [Corynebacterium zhongnanshanii]MCR5914012.1 DNA polymerase Y family protein [Corynebacterium sp. zg254]
MSALPASNAAPAHVHGRVTVLWFPDWPVYAVGQALGWNVLEPAAVIAEHKVMACNAAARRCGVRMGMKQRHALAACPTLNIAPDDPMLQAATHEDVVAALDSVSACVETIRPGLLAFPMGSLANFYGSEDVAVEKLLDAAVRINADCLAGTSDDVVSAVWAARSGKNIPPGEVGHFIEHLPLAMMSVEPALDAPYALVHTLQQLGMKTMRDFAALDRADVAARFGSDAVPWHRIACNEDSRTIAPRAREEHVEVRHEAEHPIASTETAAFVARHVASQLHAELSAAGDACLRLAVRAYLTAPAGYEGPTVIERIWRCREPLTEQDTAQRVRWQLDGWITRLGSVLHDQEYEHVPAGIQCLELVPLDTVPAGTIDMPLWGGPDEGIRAARAAAGRAQALIGMNAVQRPIHQGGRAVAGRIVTVPYGEEDPEAIIALPTRAWEGQLISPLPALIGTPAAAPADSNAPAVHPAARVQVVDRDGTALYVTGRGMLSARPSSIQWGARRYTITGWAGPWPVDEQWWAEGKRYARLQVSAEEADGTTSAYLLVSKGTQWRIEATY